MRKGMGLGRGKGYKNIIHRDKSIHSQSARGIKQPQKLRTGTFIKSKFTNAEGVVLSTEPFRVKYNYKGKVRALPSNPKFWKKAQLKDSDGDGVPNKIDCKPFDPKRQDLSQRQIANRNYEKYILDSISAEGYGLDKEPKTNKEKLQFVKDTFRSEYWNNNPPAQRLGEQRAFAEYLSGLPSTIDLPFYNYDILKFAKKMGSLPRGG